MDARRATWLKWGAVGVVGAVVFVVAGVLLYTKVLNNPPDRLDSSDLDVALTTTSAPAGSSTAPSSTAGTSLDGTWDVSSDSQLGYRVKEVLFGSDTEGVGRTHDVTGSLTIAGSRATAARFTVDMATVTSDSGRRDGQYRDRIMEVDRFPTSSFTLTAPIDFGSIPKENEKVTASATGDLTLHGVTKSVTFDVQASFTAGRIGVLSNIPIVFADYQIDNPSNGVATTGDEGLLEFVLVFDRAPPA